MIKSLKYIGAATLMVALLASPALATEKHRQSQLFAAPVEFDDAVTHNGAVTYGSTVVVTGKATFNGGATIVGPILKRSADGTPGMTKVPAPSTATTATDMTEAELLGGIHVKTPAAAQDLQVPTGTEISAAILAVQPDFAIGDSFDYTLINLGGAGDIVTLIVATGVTFVGSVTVDDPGADVNSSGTFRFRNTAANTWIAYRIA